MKNSIVKEKAFFFSLEIIKLYQAMLEKKDFVLSKQIVRCGTSIRANINEALAGQSRKDFIAKMSISSKEARETEYWLELLKQSGLIEYNWDMLIDQNQELVRMLTAIVKTSQTTDDN